MSSDDYVRLIAQKYRLAISIAILNTKPTNLTIDEYIDQIKTNDEAQNDVINISVCSDDFNIDSSDENDHQSYINQSRTSHIVNDFHNSKRNDDNDKISETRVNDRRDNEEILFTDRETHDNDRTQFNDKETQRYVEARVNNKSNGKDINTSITILHNFEDTSKIIDAKQERRDQMRELIHVLKDVDVITTDKVGIETEGLFCDSLQKILYDPMDTDLTQYYGNNYSVICDSIDVLNNADRENYKSYDQKCIQNSQRVHKVALLDTIHKEKVTENPALSPVDNTKEIRKELKKRMNNNDKINIPIPKIAKINHDSKHSKKEVTGIYTNNVTADMNIASNNSLQAARDTDVNRINTKENFLIEDNTHYSESQINEVTLNNHLIYANKNNNKQNNTKECKDKPFDILSNPQEIIKKDRKNKAINQNSIKNDTVFTTADSMMAFPNNESQARENVTENDTSLKDVRLQEIKIIEKDTFLHKINVLEDNTLQTQVFDENINKDENNKENIDKDLTDRQTEKIPSSSSFSSPLERKEKIPFKVIEEVNKIKMYLKRETNSNEYRNSQSKSYFGSSQPHSVSIGQSGNSVLGYLLSCSLVTATQELTEQISEVLGQLIDRLHAEEVYPPFLEDLLLTVEKTLELLYEEENYVFDVLLKKDEQIQRTLLLNKSTHIQKYTISKINDILQKLLDEISADDTQHDIQNINRIENLCYIFQLLHEILPKYNENSQISAINSQEDKILRKRDITDLWRKKWYPDTKKKSNEGSSTNKCVIKECGEILNKMIVKFMDGYSLIAFSALKCFNIMQS